MSNKHYVGTTFESSERPTKTKLNNFNSRIADAIELGDEALSQLAGDDRVIDDPDVTTELEVTASGTPDMYVHVNTGLAMVSGALVQNESSSSLLIVAPTTNNRYTIVQISNEGVLSTVNGVEAVSPSVPATSANNIKLADIYLPQNTTKIEDADGGFGYITDRRDIYMLHPTSVKRFLPISLPGTMLVAGGPNSDGYYFGTSVLGFTFGNSITIEKVTTQFQQPPTGADVIFTIHNLTQATSDTVTHTAGEAFDSDSTISLNFASTDQMAIQVTQVGSTLEGDWPELVIQYVLQ